MVISECIFYTDTFIEIFSHQLQPTIPMKPIQKIIAFGAIATLSITTATAVELTANSAYEIKSEDAETKTVNLKITGMT